jgi:hypothetical protein
MDAKQKKFVDWLATSCKDHDEWLTVIRYGLPTLLQDQGVLIEVLINEAKRDVPIQSTQGGRAVDANVKPDSVRRIMGELGLRFEVAR